MSDLREFRRRLENSTGEAIWMKARNNQVDRIPCRIVKIGNETVTILKPDGSKARVPPHCLILKEKEDGTHNPESH